MLVVDRATVRRLLTPQRAKELIAQGFVDFGRDRFEQPLRLATPGPGGRTLLVKPATRGGDEPLAGAKLLEVGAGGAGRPAVQGVMVLFDPETGAPDAVLDAAALTEIRTAAASAVATDLLAPAGGECLAILGAGSQGRAHAEALASSRSIRRIRIWNRTAARAAALASELHATLDGIEVRAVSSVSDACRGASIICTTTSSPQPVLDVDDLEPGAHVNAVGAFRPSDRELTSDLVARSWVVVDDRVAAEREAGDLLLPAEEGAIEMPAHIRGELAELLGDRGETPPAGATTVFKSLGLAFQDLVTAADVVSTARRSGEGREVALW